MFEEEREKEDKNGTVRERVCGRERAGEGEGEK